MSLLKEYKLSLKEEFSRFAKKEIAPYSESFEETESIPRSIIEKIAAEKYLGSFLPEYFGGKEIDMISYGYLTEEIGKASSSVRSLLTVQDMVSSAIFSFGTDDQKDELLPKLISGKIIAALSITEENSGSDLKSQQMKAEENDTGFIINGRKKWITFGSIADIFLVLADVNGKATTFLVNRETEGLSVHPTTGLLGVRATMVADINFENAFVSKENILGSVGAGFNFIISHALRLGRYSVAWGCVGISQASLEASLTHAKTRVQFGKALIEHQLIQEMISNMITNTKAARLLCIEAGKMLQKNHHDSVQDVLVAKYFSSRAAVQSSSDAVQILGALGCSSLSPVQRYFRDAKVMEIIEGTTQIHQILIAKHASVGL